MVRGASTVTGDNQPLFVVNGSPMGTSYQTIAGMVEVADIKSIEVLKDVSSTNSYGVRGAAGVILIKTRKQ
jgi:TonB-dependent SusC/RagA subfamily outer membrane receptor